MPIVWFREVKNFWYQPLFTFPLIGDVTLRQFIYLSIAAILILTVAPRHQIFPAATIAMVLGLATVFIILSIWPIKAYPLEIYLYNLLFIRPDKPEKPRDYEKIYISMLGRPVLIDRKVGGGGYNVAIYLVDRGVENYEEFEEARKIRLSLARVSNDGRYSFWFTPNEYGEYHIIAVSTGEPKIVDRFLLEATSEGG